MFSDEISRFYGDVIGCQFLSSFYVTGKMSSVKMYLLIIAFNHIISNALTLHLTAATFSV